MLALDQGANYQFGFTAYDENQQNVLISPSLAEWTMTGDEIGTLSRDGMLNVTAESGNASVSARFMGKTFTTNVVVGLKEQIIDDYEGNEVAYHINSPYIYPNRPDYRGGRPSSGQGDAGKDR